MNTADWFPNILRHAPGDRDWLKGEEKMQIDMPTVVTIDSE